MCRLSVILLATLDCRSWYWHVAIVNVHMCTCAALWVALDTQACSSWYQSVPGGSLGAMAAASAASLDPESLVDTFLWEKASLRRTYMNHQLLKAREKATKRELEIIYRKLSLTLHPDKGVFHNWLMENYPDLDTDSYTNATNLMKHFWATWQATKERLMDLEDGFFKQAGVFVVCACVCDLCLAHAFLSTYGSESVSIHLQVNCHPGILGCPGQQGVG